MEPAIPKKDNPYLRFLEQGRPHVVGVPLDTAEARAPGGAGNSRWSDLTSGKYLLGLAA